MDDNIETIKKRFKVFVEQSMPVIATYEGLSKVSLIILCAGRGRRTAGPLLHATQALELTVVCGSLALA